MRSPPNGTPEYKAGWMLKRRIAGFCAAIMGAICILIVQAVINERDAASDRAGAEVANLAAGFEEGVRAILDGIAGASEFLKDHIEEKEAKGETFDLADWRSKVSEFVRPTIDIFVVGADAKLRATTFAHDER